MATNLWTRNELILAFNLYLKLPFGKMHSRTPEIIHLANIIGRTPDSVAIRLTNFAHIDPYHQQRCPLADYLGNFCRYYQLSGTARVSHAIS